MTKRAKTRQNQPRLLLRSWWFIAPGIVAAAALHVFDHTVARYATGRAPDTFGLHLTHGDAWILWVMPLFGLLVLAGIAWLALAAYRLLRGARAPRAMIWRMLILLVALSVPLLPARFWDEALLRTTGPGKAAGDLLASAAAQGDVARLRQLLDRGIAPDAPNEAQLADSPALWVAVRESRPEATALLLERGADPNRRSHYGAVPLLKAAETGNVTIARLLVERGANPCASEIRYSDPGKVRTEVSARSVAQSKGDAALLAILPGCLA